MHSLILRYVSVTIYFLPPATKLGQGYIFTGVCHSVKGEVVCSRGGLVMGGLLLGGMSLVETPVGRPLLRAVRILLECILVS